MEIPTFTIKRFRVPVEIKTIPATEEEPEHEEAQYSPVDMNEYFLDEEEVDTTPVTREENPEELGEFIRKEAVKIKEYNRMQVKAASFDKEITTVTMKVLCKK